MSTPREEQPEALPTEVRAAKAAVRLWRRTPIELLRDNPWWGFIGIALAVLGLVLTLVMYYFPDALRPEAPMQLGEQRRLGPVTVGVTGFSCGQGLDDLSQGFRDTYARDKAEHPEIELYKGQLCIADIEALNHSTAVVPAEGLFGVARAQGNEYPAIAQDSEEVLTLFPGEAIKFRIVFDVARDVEPTALTLSWLDEDDLDISV